MNDEGVIALLGMVLLQQPNQEVRVPYAQVVAGLPSDSAVKVFHHEATNELVIRIAKVKEEE